MIRNVDFIGNAFERLPESDIYSYLFIHSSAHEGAKRTKKRTACPTLTERRSSVGVREGVGTEPGTLDVGVEVGEREDVLCQVVKRHAGGTLVDAEELVEAVSEEKVRARQNCRLSTFFVQPKSAVQEEQR